MGKSYNRILSQFSKGEYTGATDTKDDLAVMSGFMPYRSDDTGNTAGTAKALGSNADGSYQQKGIIERTGDKDVYSFSWGGGNLVMRAAQAPSYIITTNLAGNVDPAIRILNAAGQEVAASDPAGIEAATVNMSLPAGVYYAEIRGVGYLNPANTGYSAYASLGEYIITGSASTAPAPPAANQPPVASISPSATSGVAPLTIALSSAGSTDPEGGALTYAWNFGNGLVSSLANPSTTFNQPGTYEVVLTVTDNVGLTATAKTVITVTTSARPMTVSSLSIEKVTGGQNYGIATVKVVDQDGAPVVGATVTGTWSGPTSGSGTATTGSDGIALIRSKKFKLNKGSTSRTLTFQVTQVTNTSSILNYQWDGKVVSTSVVF